MAERAFIMEPLPDSMEEASASGRSVGLTKSNGKRGERGQPVSTREG
jgi:hypothetical protein